MLIHAIHGLTDSAEYLLYGLVARSWGRRIPLPLGLHSTQTIVGNTLVSPVLKWLKQVFDTIPGSANHVGKARLTVGLDDIGETSKSQVLPPHAMASRVK